jgi:hypothetical protein
MLRKFQHTPGRTQKIVLFLIEIGRQKETTVHILDFKPV